MRRIVLLVLALIVSHGPAASAEDQDGAFDVRLKYVRECHPEQKTIVCPRVDKGPVLDGKIDDPVWQQAARNTSAFTQIGSQDPVARQTIFLICRDEANLYLTFSCEEKELEQQQIDNKDVGPGDHVGIRFEVGDTRGRGAILSVYGNRAGKILGGPWREPESIIYKCAAGPNCWYVQMGIPFRCFPTAGPPAKGDLWGMKLRRFGKSIVGGRMRSSWPVIPTGTDEMVLYNGLLYFEANLGAPATALPDDVPNDWCCLTNNDWKPERNLKNRYPGSSEGVYTYLKRTGYNAGPGPTAPRPDIGEDEVENFPVQWPYPDGPFPIEHDWAGLIDGSVDKGGSSGWIPFAKGSLTGDESWAGWPFNKNFGDANPHDVLFDFNDRYFIRRVDILQVQTCFRGVDIAIRSSADPGELFLPIFKLNGPGTTTGYPWGGQPPYLSFSGLDSVARQLRLCFGVFRPDGQYGAACETMGLAEIWIWGEPKGAHADTEVKVFKPYVPETTPPPKLLQLHKLSDPVIWPTPKKLVRADGRFEVVADTALVVPDQGQLRGIAGQLQGDLRRRFLADLTIVDAGQVKPAQNRIWFGMKSLDPNFDDLCAKEGVAVPDRDQGYALKVSDHLVLLAGHDLQGVFNGLQSLRQWIDHDERTPFIRNLLIEDWPDLARRVILPNTDHRQSLFAGSAKNYHRISDALADLRFNVLEDYHPTQIAPDRTRYSDDRMIELCPILVGTSQQWPAECIEAGPDNQADGTAGFTGEDGTWETGNLCPSNPKTYRQIEKYLDECLLSRPSARYVDVSLLGSRGGPWNVCPRCRSRNLGDGELYADFLNRINQLCNARNRTAIITNAVMFSDPRRRPAYDLLNRAAVLRLDTQMERPSIVEGGFWNLSRPFDAPWAFRVQYQRGEAYRQEVLPGVPTEGMLGIGDLGLWRCWGSELGGLGVWTAAEFWNGPAPSRSKDAAEACDAYEQAAANACVRMHERADREMEYPSWRTGITPQFFTVDITAQCNRSHIDEGTVAGLGRSGPREGVLAMGPAYDFRRVEPGQQVYADVPFEIIDPNKNTWKSIILVADTSRAESIPGCVSRVDIPIDRKAASLCVLHTIVRQQAGVMQLGCVLTPAYVFEYSDGSRYVCDREFDRDYGWIDWQTFVFSVDGWRQGGPGSPHLRFPNRMALSTASLGGQPIRLTLSEFINPYPDKEIKRLTVQLPNPEEKNTTLALHDAIFAVTGVAPSAWDIRWWKNRPPAPLLPPTPEIPAGFSPATEGLSLSRIEGSSPTACMLSVNRTVQASAVDFRLSMPSGGYAQFMQTWYRHADCKVLVSVDQKTWKEVGGIKGCTGMDGVHRVVFPAQEVAAVLFVLDSSPYADEDGIEISVLAAGLFIRQP